MKRLGMLCAVLGLLAGCTTIDPYTGEEKTSHATTGAAVGAVSGALLGAATASDKDRAKGAAVGAVVGGAAGGGIGYYMDQQEARLRARLEQTGVRVKREGNTIRLIMPGNITFAVDSANIRSDFYPILDSVAIVLKEYHRTYVDIGGHTDNTGSYEYNQGLSEHRASSVGRYLMSRGVSSNRLHMRGYSYSQPIADNSTAHGREQNRRVEILLRPMS